MNPNAGEPDNQENTQGGIVVKTPVSEIFPDPLSNLQGVVDAAKEAAAQATAPVQASAETPQGQFKNQFGSEPATPPSVADNATVPGLIDAALANLETTPPPPAEAISTLQPEAPLDPKQEFIDTVVAATEKLRVAEGK